MLKILKNKQVSLHPQPTTWHGKNFAMAFVCCSSFSTCL